MNPDLYVIPSRHITRWLSPPLVIVGCIHPGCPFEAVRETEGQAIKSVEAHVVKKHPVEEQES